MGLKYHSSRPTYISSSSSSPHHIPIPMKSSKFLTGAVILFTTLFLFPLTQFHTPSSSYYLPSPPLPHPTLLRRPPRRKLPIEQASYLKPRRPGHRRHQSSPPHRRRSSPTSRKLQIVEATSRCSLSLAIVGAEERRRRKSNRRPQLSSLQIELPHQICKKSTSGGKRRHLPSPRCPSSSCLPSMYSSVTLPLVVASPSPSIETSDRLAEGEIDVENNGNLLAADLQRHASPLVVDPN
ncbi:unnamed protein product [Linum trigynum]|uniref:Uncharacterized protein n=1 Tax=Linum trigynum TaxID=586398 RepID=A0AAV2CES1_9ROSI